jgi:hypothetical protein
MARVTISKITIFPTTNQEDTLGKRPERRVFTRALKPARRVIVQSLYSQVSMLLIAMNSAVGN